MTNRSQRYDINRPRHILEPKYSKCKMLSIMIVICIKRHLSNIWSSIHEKVHESNTEAELKKRVAYTKKKRAAWFLT